MDLNFKVMLWIRSLVNPAPSLGVLLPLPSAPCVQSRSTLLIRNGDFYSWTLGCPRICFFFKIGCLSLNTACVMVKGAHKTIFRIIHPYSHLCRHFLFLMGISMGKWPYIEYHGRKWLKYDRSGFKNGHFGLFTVRLTVREGGCFFTTALRGSKTYSGTP